MSSAIAAATCRHPSFSYLQPITSNYPASQPWVSWRGRGKKVNAWLGSRIEKITPRQMSAIKIVAGTTSCLLSFVPGAHWVTGLIGAFYLGRGCYDLGRMHGASKTEGGEGTAKHATRMQQLLKIVSHPAFKIVVGAAMVVLAYYSGPLLAIMLIGSLYGLRMAVEGVCALYALRKNTPQASEIPGQASDLRDNEIAVNEDSEYVTHGNNTLRDSDQDLTAFTINQHTEQARILSAKAAQQVSCQQGGYYQMDSTSASTSAFRASI